MVARHSQVLTDHIQAIIPDTRVAGKEQMHDVLLMTTLAKHGRPGRIGYSPRALIFGLVEKLLASGLGHYLEQHRRGSDVKT